MDMAVVIQNILQYYSLRPFLQLVKKTQCWKNDIYVYDPQETQTGFSDIMQELKQAIVKDGFTIANDKSKAKKYKVCLAPYQDMMGIKSDYLIGYYYGALNSKPFTFAPESKSKFHGFLLHSNYDAEILSVYGKTYVVPRLSLREIKPKKHSGKKCLLYLPTYGKESGIETVAKFLPELKKDYEILIKSHHGTAHLKNELGRKTDLREIADHYYEPTKCAQELFEEADVVLSDNSGAIFDALYVKKPICILSNNINNVFAGISPLQKKLVDEKVIPYSDKASADELYRIIGEALSPKIVKVQSKTSDALFPNKNSGAEAWVKVLSAYMNDSVNMDYVRLHDYRLAQQNNLAEELATLRQREADLLSTIHNLNAQLDEYKNGKLYRFAKKIYKVKNGE